LTDYDVFELLQLGSALLTTLEVNVRSVVCRPSNSVESNTMRLGGELNTDQLLLTKLWEEEN
jgi:hypothetical protein